MTDTFYADHLERLVQGYARAAMTDLKAVKNYIWDVITDLEKSDPLLWPGLSARVLERKKEMEDAGNRR